MLLAESYVERNTTTITVIVAVVLALVGWWLVWYFRQKDRQTKTFDYEILDDVSIFTGDERPPALKVTSGGREVTAPRITRVRFKNTGRQVIKKADVLQPYKVVRGSAHLLDFQYADESVETLDELADIKVSVDLTDGDVKFASNVVEISPNTLNQGDWFIIQFMHDGGKDEPLTITGGRIKGETRPSRSIALEKFSGKPLFAPILAMVLALAAGVGLSNLTMKFPDLGWPVTWGMMGLLLIAGVLFLRDVS